MSYVQQLKCSGIIIFVWIKTVAEENYKFKFRRERDNSSACLQTVSNLFTLSSICFILGYIKSSLGCLVDADECFLHNLLILLNRIC